MNLEKLLAENMIRFGVKNLDKQLHKTLLNEGYVAGAGVSLASEYTYAYDGASTTAVAQKLQPYTSDPILNAAAIIALATSCRNIISTRTKTLKNAQRTYYGSTVNTIQLLINTVASNQSSIDAEQLDQIISAANFEYTQTEVAVYPAIGAGDPTKFLTSLHPTNGKNYVATLGKVDGKAGVEGGVVKTGNQTWTNYGLLIKYLNGFNVNNTDENDYTQYRLSTMLDSNNFVNYLMTEVATNTVIVYTKTTKIPNFANKTVGTNTQGATEPIPKDYDVSFEQGKSAVPAADPEVAKAVADAIAMFPDGNITNLSVISSASPDYVTIKNVPGWEKSYPNGIDGTTDPGPGTDDASKNIKLAYDRGVNFVAAINAGLVAQGKPEMINTSINWKISATGGTKVPGRYAKVLWKAPGTPGTDVSTTDNTGTTGATKAGGDTFTVFQHVFTVK